MKLFSRFLIVVLCLLIRIDPLISQWIKSSTPSWGSMKSIITVKGKVFGGTEKGVYLSLDNGTVWKAINTGLTNTSVNSLAVSSDSTAIYAGTTGGVFLTVNNGTSWTIANTGLTNTYVNGLAVSGANLFAATLGGVFISSNRGSSWTAINAGLTNKNIYSIAVRGTYLYVGTDDGVSLSTNNGASWRAANTGLMNTDANCLAANGSSLYLGTFAAGVYVSANNGTVWVAANTGLTNSYINAFVYSDTNLFAGTNSGVFLSTNSGVSGSSVNTDLSYINISSGLLANSAIRTLAISGTNLIAGTNDGSIWLRTLIGFTSAPAAPVTSAPLAGTTGISLSPSLTWNTSPGSLSYQLQLSTDSIFTNVVFNQTGITSTSYTASGLLNNTTYYWRVLAVGTVGKSAWSAVKKFTTITLPEIRVNKLSIQFGNIAKNASIHDVVHITNGTAGALLVGPISSGHPYFAYSSEPVTLTNVDTTKLTVSFTPLNFGVFHDTVTIRSNSPGSVVRIPITGTSPYPVINLNKPTISYGMVAAGTTRRDTLLVSNSSVNGLSMSSINTSTSAFSVDRSSGFVGTEAMKIVVSFTPSKFGDFNDTVKILNNSLVGVVKIPVAGTSPSPVIKVNKSSISYGMVATGTTRRDTLVVSNSSISALTMDSIYTTTRAFSADRISGSVGTDAIKIIVSFTPQEISSYQDTLYVRNNSSQSLVKIPVSGESPLPVISFAPDAFRKDTVAVGDSTTQTFVVRNSSINELPYDILPTKTNSFIIGGTLAGRIKPNESSTVTIRFKPASFGEFIDTMKISSLGRTVAYPLMGSSPYPLMTMSRSTFDFGNVGKDKSLKIHFTIKNTSPNTLRIDSIATTSRQFIIEPGNSPFSVRYNDSAIVAITFTPDSLKSYQGTLSIFTNQQTPMVVAGLHGYSTLTSVYQTGDMTPSAYALRQNFPNPFNPSTTFSYSLPVRSHVRLHVYSILGQQVAELVDADQPAGTFQVTWNADVTSGMYFYRIEAVSHGELPQRFADVKKMIFMR